MADAERYLLLRAGDAFCALPLQQVRRVVRALTIHALPGAAPELLGLAEFAGEPLPVLDLGMLLGEASSAAAGSQVAGVTVVARIGDSEPPEIAGLAADEALEISALEMTRGTGASSRHGMVVGEALAGERHVTVLDLAAWKAA